LQIVPQSRFKQGAPIKLSEGILFTTYATLRSDERQGRDGAVKASRLSQIIDWLGADFDGVIVFDEAHALANAAGDKGERGEKIASQQGRAGLRLQNALPGARVLYVSATGATTVGEVDESAIIGEGIETVLSLKSAYPDIPLIAALSAAHLAAWRPPSTLQRLVIAADNDEPGRNAARYLSKRMSDHRVDVNTIEPLGDDFNSELLKTSREGMRDRVERLNCIISA
jgi:hypothetical protein